MLGKAPLAALLTVGVVFAMPLSAAFAAGVDADSVPEMKAAGAAPAYGQVWVGSWVKQHGWSGIESDLRKIRDAGATPVIQWYYWGDDISPNCVKYGCNGRTKGEWDWLAGELARRAAAVMGSRTFLVVVEPEFNKNGIKDWDTFDGYLANQASIIRSKAPSADIVVGFGHWGGWDIFDRAVAASDMVGFQILYGSTRNSASTATGAADYMISVAQQLKERWGKPVIIFDYGIATYGGWEWVQEKSIQNVIAKRSQLDAAGVRAIVWRYVYDNDHSSGYFGAAESSWGVKYRNGGHKAGYNDLVNLLKGSSGSTGGTTTSTTTTSPSTAPASSVFSGVTGNAWWIQAKVSGSPTRVDARVNGGSWVGLDNKGWGWAKSVHAPTGSTVDLRATYGDGTTASATYAWPPGSSPTSSTSSGFDATFSGIKLQEWWVQASVKGTQPIAKVEARVNGGSWIALDDKGWGWAKSIKVAYGAKVEFRATSSTGATDVSGAYSR